MVELGFVCTNKDIHLGCWIILVFSLIKLLLKGKEYIILKFHMFMSLQHAILINQMDDYLSLQEVFGLQKSRVAKEVKVGRNWREACGVGSPQYGRYFTCLWKKCCHQSLKKALEGILN